MNRYCMVAILGVLVQADLISRAEADLYLERYNQALEDGEGAHLYTIEKALEVLNG